MAREALLHVRCEDAETEVDGQQVGQPLLVGLFDGDAVLAEQSAMSELVRKDRYEPDGVGRLRTFDLDEGAAEPEFGVEESAGAVYGGVR